MEINCAILCYPLNSALYAFKCNLKKLTTKSALSAWGQRSFGMRMPSSSLHRSCDSLARPVFPRAVFFLFSPRGSSTHFLPLPPPPRHHLCLGFVLVVAVFFFLHWCFSVWRVPVPFLLSEGSWLSCTVVPVMGALFQSTGWLLIVEAPGYSRHPTSTSAMQLLTSG